MKGFFTKNCSVLQNLFICAEATVHVCLDMLYAQCNLNNEYKSLVFCSTSRICYLHYFIPVLINSSVFDICCSIIVLPFARNKQVATDFFLLVQVLVQAPYKLKLCPSRLLHCSTANSRSTPTSFADSEGLGRQHS